jgi:hypothetical protein
MTTERDPAQAASASMVEAIGQQPVQPNPDTPTATPAGQPPAAKPQQGAASAWPAVLALLARWRATAHGVEPEFWRSLGREFATGRQWLDRAVVLSYAAATGLVVVGFTLLAEAASHGFEQLRPPAPGASGSCSPGPRR